MTFLRGVLLISGKEFRHLRHDPGALSLIVVVPVLFFLIFGYALDPRVRNVPTAVQNLDGERFSRALVDQLQTSPVFRITRSADSQEQLLRLVRNGEVRVAIQIPPRFSIDTFYGRPAAIRVWIDGSDAVLAGQTVSAAQAVDVEHAVAMLVSGSPVRRSRPGVQTQVLYTPDGRSADSFIPPLIPILAEMSALLLISLSLVRERERGTLEQLRITSVSPAALMTGKIAACAAGGMVVALSLTLLSRVVFGIGMGWTATMLLASVPVFLMAPLGIGLIIGAHARNQAQSLQLTYLATFPASLLSGFVFPRYAMPEAVRIAGTLLPTTWSVEIARGLVLRGSAFSDIAGPLAVSAVLGLLYLSLGAVQFRRILRG